MEKRSATNSYNRRVVLHTDSAKSYKLKIGGVIHDRVVQAKKRVEVDGKFRWLKPHYVKLVQHKVPNTNRTITVKSGTQIIDLAWRFLKDRIIVNQNCRARSKALRAKLRSAQYEYWHKNDDLYLWLHCGMLCSRSIKKLVNASAGLNLSAQPSFRSTHTCDFDVTQVSLHTVRLSPM